MKNINDRWRNEIFTKLPTIIDAPSTCHEYINSETIKGFISTSSEFPELSGMSLKECIVCDQQENYNRFKVKEPLKFLYLLSDQFNSSVVDVEVVQKSHQILKVLEQDLLVLCKAKLKCGNSEFEIELQCVQKSLSLIEEFCKEKGIGLE